MTFAHEVGHNLGAPHDQDVNCPDGFIMSESGSKRNIHEHTVKIKQTFLLNDASSNWFFPISSALVAWRRWMLN